MPSESTAKGTRQPLAMYAADSAGTRTMTHVLQGSSITDVMRSRSESDAMFSSTHVCQKTTAMLNANPNAARDSISTANEGVPGTTTTSPVASPLTSCSAKHSQRGFARSTLAMNRFDTAPANSSADSTAPISDAVSCQSVCRKLATE